MTTLTTTQRSALVAINHKNMTAFALQRELQVSKVLAENLLMTLAEAGMAKQYGNGQYTPTDAGKAYLSGGSVAEKSVFAVGKTRGRPAKQQKKQPAKNSAADMAALAELDTKPAEAQQTTAELPTAREQAVVGEVGLAVEPVVMPVAELPLADQALPVDIDLRLSELEQKLTAKIITPSDIDLKVKVLNRLGALLEPSISEVLTAIAADLQQLQKAA